MVKFVNNKGQSALEYLMTYGWALIVVAVIIGHDICNKFSSRRSYLCSSIHK